MSASKQIKWYENAAWDAPELNSPQPCIHGAGCVFTIKNADGKILPGCCRYVHPGEEGTGRRFFEERTLQDGTVQNACVRLTGAAHQFYERRGRKIPWQEWCKQQGIPFTPNKPGEQHVPVKRVPFGKGPKVPEALKKPEAPKVPKKPMRIKTGGARKPSATRAPVISCKTLEAGLLFSALQKVRLGEVSRAGGNCSAGCACFFGGQCIDASNEAAISLAGGYQPTSEDTGPGTGFWSPYLPVVPGPRVARVPVARVPEPPTPLNLLPGYNTPVPLNLSTWEDNGCSTPMLSMPTNADADEENETPLLTPTLIPNQNLEELD